MPEYSNYIEGLTEASELTGDEIVGLSQGGSPRKTTTQDIANLGAGGGGTVTSVSGTTNRIAVDLTKPAIPDLDIDPAYDAAITAEIAAAVALRQLLVNAATALTDASSMA